MLAVAILLSACGGIESGTVGVRKSFWNDVYMEEEQVGFYTAVFDSVTRFSIKEIAVELDGLTPKAKDNLSLKDLDVTVYYRVNPSQIAEMYKKYSGQSPYDSHSGTYFPLFTLVENVARSVAYDEAAKFESLQMHLHRAELETGIQNGLQAKLDADDQGVFTVTRAVVRSVITDPQIEASIQLAIARQKELEAMKTQVEIAAKNAEVRVAEARGVAEANHIINKSLTREYLQHEVNVALLEFAKKGENNTVVIPYNPAMAPLINIGK